MAELIPARASSRKPKRYEDYLALRYIRKVPDFGGIKVFIPLRDVQNGIKPMIIIFISRSQADQAGTQSPSVEAVVCTGYRLEVASMFAHLQCEQSFSETAAPY